MSRETMPKKRGPKPRPASVRFWEKVDCRSPSDCWPWTGTTTLGYGRFGSRGAMSVLAHRYSWELANGPIPEGLVIRHSCDNPRCVNPSHLLSGTQNDNVRDMWGRGRARQGRVAGIENGMSKLTEDDVIDIRTAYALGATQDDIAKAYGVCFSNISSIVRRKTWAQVP